MQASSALVSLAKWASVPAALVASSALVWQASYSSFTATTDNPANSWATGSVTLSDDDGGSTALFTASNLKPGATGTKCIVVTSSGTLASTVKLYGANPSTTNALSSYLDLTIDEGTGGTFGTSGPTSCTGFSSASNAFTGSLASFASTKTGFATGVGSWAPTGATTQTRTYRFTYTVNNSVPNSSQSGTANIGFTWEAQNS